MWYRQVRDYGSQGPLCWVHQTGTEMNRDCLVIHSHFGTHCHLKIAIGRFLPGVAVPGILAPVQNLGKIVRREPLRSHAESHRSAILACKSYGGERLGSPVSLGGLQEDPHFPLVQNYPRNMRVVLFHLHKEAWQFRMGKQAW